MQKTLNIIAVIGLGLGSVFGLAGTMVTQPHLRSTFWAIDASGLVMACALLTIKFFRKGNDLVSAGFLVFAIGEGVILSGTAANLVESVPAFAAGTALWATGLLLISIPREFAVWVRVSGNCCVNPVHDHGNEHFRAVVTNFEATAVLCVSIPGDHFQSVGFGACSRHRGREPTGVAGQDEDSAQTGEWLIFAGQRPFVPMTAAEICSRPEQLPVPGYPEVSRIGIQPAEHGLAILTRMSSSRDELLSDLKNIVSTTLDRATSLQHIANLIRSHAGYRWVGIYDVDHAAGVVSNVVWSGPGAPQYPTFPLTKGLTGAAVAEQRIVNVADVSTDPRYLTAFGTTRSEIIVPIFDRHGKSVVGTIDVESEELNAFGGDDVPSFLQACSDAIRPLWKS